MGSDFKNILYQDSGYPIRRNLVNLPFKKYIPTKKIGLLKIMNHIHYKAKGTNPFLSNSHWELFKKRNALWHLWNGISFGKTAWITSFETTLPRWHTANKSVQRHGIKALTTNRCKKLIAISECTKEFQTRYLEEEFPEFKSQIVPKINVIHPPQKPLINSFNEKKLSKNKITFTMVGAAFFIKGGKEILYVFDRLLQKKAPIELHIVSTLKMNDYVTNTTNEDLKEAKKLIHKYPKSIHHYEYLPNEKVLNLLKNSHIGLLPSFSDTYGYSVLEAQASGCPVITTNIRALPEINNNRCGWMIDVPKNRWGRGKVNTKEERSRYSIIIQERLHEIISGIISNPDQIAEKGVLSLKRIEEDHDPENVAQKLEQIYDEALG